MEHFKNFLRGFGNALSIAPPPRGYKVETRGFQRDSASLGGDFAAVGNDMRVVLKRDKQAYERSRKG